MSFFGTASVAPSVASSNSTTAPAEKDVEVADPPSDSISSLSFSGQADYLAAGSWDNNVRIYEVGANGQTQGKAMYSHQGPVLSVCWNKEGNKIISGGADNVARMFDVTTGQAAPVAQHDAPVRCVKWVDAQGGYWQRGAGIKQLSTGTCALRTPRATHTDIQPNQPNHTVQDHDIPLKWQTRVVSCFTAAASSGFAVGSVEGRVAIQYVEDKDAKDNFSFKCHRRDSSASIKDQALVYAVNDISFHPVHGTFSTCGSDGGIHFWDKDARSRLKSFDTAPGPISATTFNRNGNIFAYAISYDWSKGHSGMTPGHPNKILLHACKDDEVKKRQKK
ncbi:hypothetical protein EYR38_007729 [Pleurotus pulmonarius]|nr:hypothetical protein EYR38_007729 [Pleurotus pulmonarius]